MSVLAPEQAAQLEQEAQAAIDQAAIRLAGQIEEIRKAFSAVCGTGRTAQAIVLGKLITETLVPMKGTSKRQEALKEIASQVTGRFSDNEKMRDFVVLYHVSLRVKALADLPVSLTTLALQASKAGIDFKNVCDTLTADKTDRLQHILSLLIDGTDNIGCDQSGKTDRKVWRAIIRCYVDTGKMPEPKPVKEEKTETTENTQEPTGESGRTVQPVSLAELFRTMSADELLSFVKSLDDVTLDSLSGAVELVYSERSAVDATTNAQQAIAA